MTDIVFFENHKVILPYEIYYFSNDKIKLVFILNNAQPLIYDRVYFAKKIVEWCTENSFSQGIFIGGLDKSTKEPGEKHTFKLRPDPAAAAIAVKVISEMLNLDVSVEKLYEDARTIEKQMKRFEEFQKFLERRAHGRISHYM